MMEIITLAAAQAIAKIALDKFVEGGAGELGKKLTEPVAEKVMASICFDVFSLLPTVFAGQGYMVCRSVRTPISL
jgi:hypothetical protein